MADGAPPAPAAAPRSLRVAVLQNAPVLGDPAASMRAADELLEAHSAADALHVLLLPEMAFSGYTFADRAAIRPHLEEAAAGPTFEWCSRQARRLRCSVVCGFPRVHRLPDGSERCYNSVMVVGPGGDLVFVYDKHHLYLTDKTWADEGAAFATLELPNLPGVRVGLGICMDINPYEFKAPWTAFELATFHKQAGTQLLLFSSAWCNSHPDDSLATKLKPPNVGDTLNYWASRLTPLLGTDVAFVAADRVGTEPCAPIGKEGEIIFCGGSCFLDLKTPEIVGVLDWDEQGVLVRDLPLRPAAPIAERPRPKPALAY